MSSSRGPARPGSPPLSNSSVSVSACGSSTRMRRRRRRAAPLAFSHARTLELLEPTGATARLIAAGVRLKGFRVVSGGRARASLDVTRLKHRFNFMLSLPQSRTEAILAECLAERGVTVERGRRVTTITSGASGAEVVVTGPDEQVAAGWLVGADGAHSTVRKALDIGFPGASYPFEWSLADVDLLGDAETDRAEILLEPGAPLLLRIPIGPRRHRLIANGPDVLGYAPAHWKLGTVYWQSSYRVSHRQAERLGVGRVWLVGDAAHIHSPAGGRGMNLGIEGGVTLARRIAAGDLGGWAAERHAKARATVRESDMMQRVATSDGPIVRRLAPRLIGLMVSVPPLHDRLITRLAGSS